jgi:cytochrome c peroxidase
MTEEGIELGRFLFYEKRLSGDNTMNCASCHLSENAFAESSQYSTGIDGISGTRNAMPLFNLGWEEFFFWDGRESSLEAQILEPVPNPIEMHQEWQQAVEKLSIDATKVSKAIAQFLRTIVSSSSKFDVMYKYEYGIQLSADENTMLQNIEAEEWAGYDLFKSLNGADCFHCHNGPLMRVKKFSNNGLDNTFTDLGRSLVTNNPEDDGKFKVPSLRNIELTAPYMHDGRFSTLDEVIEHYSSGVHISPTIDPLIEYANQGGVQLDAQEKVLLKKFLLTLTDTVFINNPKFKDPFN